MNCHKKLAFSRVRDSLLGGGSVLTLAGAHSEPGAKESHCFPLRDQGGIRKKGREKNTLLGITTHIL